MRSVTSLLEINGIHVSDKTKDRLHCILLAPVFVFLKLRTECQEEK